MAELTVTIDWLSATFPAVSGNFAATGCVIDMAEKPTPGKPVYGYTNCLQDIRGTRILWNPDRPVMGLHVMYSGSALRAIMESVMTPLEVLERTLANNGRVTRLDLAVDVHSADFDIARLYDKVRRGQFVGKARRASLVTSSDGGMTCYVGARSSDRFIRVYDKAVETGNLANKWVRIEIELKGKTAQLIAQYINKKEVSEMAKITKGLIRTQVDIDEPFWRAAFDTPIERITLPKESAPQTEAWLLGQVATAMARFIYTHKRLGLVEEFAETVATELKRLEGEEGG